MRKRKTSLAKAGRHGGPFSIWPFVTDVLCNHFSFLKNDRDEHHICYSFPAQPASDLSLFKNGLIASFTSTLEANKREALNRFHRDRGLLCPVQCPAACCWCKILNHPRSCGRKVHHSKLFQTRRGGGGGGITEAVPAFNSKICHCSMQLPWESARPP